MTADGGAISLDDFKARLPLSEIVARYVRLSRRGRDLWGCCPFHNEKTPSFHVVPDKGFYHCFGCGQHGNAIDFVMAVEGLEFGDALRRLAELTGVPLPQQRGGDEAKPDRSLLAANEAAARWFAGCLEGAQGAEARAYLARRGLDEATIARFGLGYAPARRDGLAAALRAEGFRADQLVEAGLLSAPEDGGPAYDRFRHRVMFPIQDARGRVVGFGGRALGEARAKYLNTPETPLFHKGELLYGLPLARQAARERGTVVVAEGYMDVIALARAGFANAVAPLGTAVTEAQLGLLWRLADEPLVCLDGDEAGLRAGLRLLERALPLLRPGKSLRFALLPAGSDPDEVLRRAGRERLARALAEARPLLDFLWDGELRHRAVDTPERRAALRQRFRELAQSIAEPGLRRLFRDEVRKRFEARFGGGSGSRRQQVAPPIPANDRSSGAERLRAGIEDARAIRAVERELLGPVVCRPELLAEIEEELSSLELADGEFARLRDHLLAWYSERGDLDPPELKAHLNRVGFASLVEQLSAPAPATAWYARPDLALGSLLEGWRARVAQHRRSVERRLLSQAAAAAIVEQRSREIKAHVLAVDRLINRKGGIAPRADGEEG